MNTARDFRWSRHGVKRAYERLGWAAIPAEPVVRTWYRVEGEATLWAGRSFVLIVAHGTVVTVLDEKRARRGHYRSPGMDPATEYALHSASESAPAPPKARTPSGADKLGAAHRAVLKALTKPMSVAALAAKVGEKPEDLGVKLRDLRKKGFVLRQRSKTKPP